MKVFEHLLLRGEIHYLCLALTLALNREWSFRGESPQLASHWVSHSVQRNMERVSSVRCTHSNGLLVLFSEGLLYCITWACVCVFQITFLATWGTVKEAEGDI